MKEPLSHPYAPFAAAPPRVPFNRCAPMGNELAYVTQAIAHGHPAGDGEFGRRCEALLEGEYPGSRVLLTGSATQALEMAALLLDVGPGDEVIVPTLTFVSTANAFVLRGAKPVFVDVRPDTLNLDEALVAERCGPRTKAIVPVHYGGVGCDLDAICRIAQSRGVTVVEDNAHGHFARRGGQRLGGVGKLGVLSFHESKNFSCGEGGALVINDLALTRRAEILREKGTNRSAFHRGEANYYEWLDVGSSFLMSELEAAFLLGQLEAKERILAARREIWHRYLTALGGWSAAHEITLPTIPVDAQPSYHVFWLLLPEARHRDELIGHLGERGIVAAFHYLPLHRSSMAVRLGANDVRCPVADSVSSRLVRLPLYNSLSVEDQASVIDAVLAWVPA